MANLRIVPIFLCVVLLTGSLHAYSGGSGTEADPYQIATAQDLINLGNTPEDYDKHFILTADIDLDPNLPGGRVFDRSIIASEAAQDSTDWPMGFSGSLDGEEHAIHNLTIDGISGLSLFGVVAQDGRISNLGIVEVNITGQTHSLGALVADNAGTLTNCYATGSVLSTDEVSGDKGENIGGLVGWNLGIVDRCWTDCTVCGSHDA